SAYDRWYEGRKLWGSLVNNCRNLAIRLNVMIPATENDLRRQVQQLIANYPFAAKDHLRGTPPKDVVPGEHLSAEEIRYIAHLPNLVAARLTTLCADICRRHSVSQNDYRLLSENLGSLTDIIGSCERIKSTPIPY